jgi:hypothetical protein
MSFLSKDVVVKESGNSFDSMKIALENYLVTAFIFL